MSEASSAPAAIRVTRERLSFVVGIGVALIVAAWWPFTDRLDVLELALLAALGVGGTAVSVARGAHRASLSTLLLGGLLVAAVVSAPIEMAARVEGWVGWAAAVAVAWLAAQSEPATVGRFLGGAGVVVAGIALMQAAGLDILAGSHAVVGPRGTPQSLGRCLALVLPFCGLVGRSSGALCALAITSGLVVSADPVAYGMALVALPFSAFARRGWAELRWGLLLGAAAGLAVAIATGRPTLSERLPEASAEVAEEAAVHWQVALGDPQGWLLQPHGPEAYVRRFPPTLRVARSDDPALAPAHPAQGPDVLQFGAAYGGLGLLLLFGLLGRALSSGPLQRAPVGVLLAIAVGGLVVPVLHAPPGLALAAVAVGLRRGARRPRTGPIPFGMVPLVVGIGLGAGLLVPRVASEVWRSDARLQRETGASGEARAFAERAVALDPRNARAWSELARSCAADRDTTCACVAWAAAAPDRPTDEVVGGCRGSLKP